LTTTLSPRSQPGRFVFRTDVLLLLTTLAVATIGVVIVYSATRSKAPLLGVGPHYYLDHQAAYAVVGTLVMFGLMALDYRYLEHVSALLYVGIILALLATRVIGSSEQGATRWIELGPVQVQPSELATLVLIVTVATFCARRPAGLDFRDLVKVLLLALVPILLVVKQPDVGSGIIMCIVLLVMLVVAGIPNRYLLLLIATAALGVVAILHFGILQQYQAERLTSFLHQSKNSQTSTYNLQQSIAAIGSGGTFGKGLFHGPQTNLAYVPEQQTDFIFSAVGEQLGLVGSVSVLLLLGLVAWRLLRSAQLARDPFGRLLATGAFTFLAFSTFENAGMSMGIMPIAGIPLPFLSYGGSATVAFFAAIGITLSVYWRHTR
jgi:rod shape determining protein RodA